jgi:hypothetical protein
MGRVAVGIHADGDERGAGRGRTQLLVGAVDLVRDQRTDVRAVRVEKRQHDDLPAVLRQRHHPAVLVGQAEVRRHDRWIQHCPRERGRREARAERAGGSGDGRGDHHGEREEEPATVSCG